MLRDIAREHLGERREEIEVLFHNRSEIGSDGADGVGALVAAKAAGDLLLDLGHSDGLFGEVVAEGDERIGSEPQDIIDVVAQSSVEIEGHALRGTPPFAAGGFLRMGGGDKAVGCSARMAWMRIAVSGFPCAAMEVVRSLRSKIPIAAIARNSSKMLPPWTT